MRSESEFTDIILFGQILPKFLQDVYQSLTCCFRLNLVSVFPYLSSKGNRISDCATFNTLCKKNLLHAFRIDHGGFQQGYEQKFAIRNFWFWLCLE